MKILIAFLLIGGTLLGCAPTMPNQYEYEVGIKEMLRENKGANVQLTAPQVFELLAPIIAKAYNRHPNKDSIKIPLQDIALLVSAMVVNETGYLQSGLVKHNNLLGIGKLKMRESVVYETWEEYNGKRVNEKKEFAVFYSFDDCIYNFLTLIATSNNYKEVRKKTDLYEFLLSLGTVYATDSAYASKVYKIMEKIKSGK